MKRKKFMNKAVVATLFCVLVIGTFVGSANQQDWYDDRIEYQDVFTHVIDTILYFNSTTGEMIAMNATTGEIWIFKNVTITKNLTVYGDIISNGYFKGDGSQLTNVPGDNMGDVDTEAELENVLTDVTNVYTNNDGSLDDDDVTLTDVQTACSNDFHNIGGTDAVDDSVSGSELDGVFSTLGLLRRTGSATYDTITDNSANWNIAYDERGSVIAGNQLNWNGNQLDVQEGSGSGLDADTLDGHDGSYYLDGGNPFDQDLNTTDDVTFNNVTITSSGLLQITPNGSANIKSLVNKEYVDFAVTSLGATYYMYDEDDATGYKTCYLNPSSDAETYIEATDLSNDDYIGGWISASGEAPTKLLKGIYDWYVTLEKTAGTKDLRVYWKLIERKADTTETVIATSSDSNIITDKATYLVPLQLNADYILDTGSRIVGKLYADISGGGSAPDVRVYYQGDTSSRWEIPANTEIFQNIFVPYDGAVKDVDLGGKNLTATDITVGNATVNDDIQLDGEIKADLGTLAQPPYTFQGLTNTGIHATASPVAMMFGVNGVSKMSLQQFAIYLYGPVSTDDKLQIADELTVGDYTFPSTDGTANQVLKTDGAGTLSWQNDNTGAGNPFNQDLNTTDDVTFHNITIDTDSNLHNVSISTNSAIYPPDVDGATGFVMPNGKDSYPFRYNTISTESGLRFNHLGSIDFLLGGNIRQIFHLYGTTAGTMEAISGSEHTNYTAAGISVETNDKAFYSATYPNAAFYFSGTKHFLLTDTSGNNIHYFKLAGDAWHKGGVRLGTDQNNNWFDDSSHGTGSTTMYIGTNTIDTSAPSDVRLKTNIKPTRYGIDQIMKLNVIDFKYRNMVDDKTHTGMLAQMVMPIVPDAVYLRSDGYYAINYKTFVPILIHAVQQQQQKIDSLQSQIDDLNARLTALEEAMQK